MPARPRSSSAMRKPRPASSPVPTRSIRAARSRRPAWAPSRSPMASRRRRFPISSAPSNLARRCPASPAIAAWPTTCSASSRRRRPTIELAMSGGDGDEARRRLALSLAISGDRAGALATLAPLSAKGDAGVARVRAFVLALTGDSNAADDRDQRGDAGQLGGGRSVPAAPARLSAGQKAAAVNLGIFPERRDAYATRCRQPTRPAQRQARTDSRASTIWLRAPFAARSDTGPQAGPGRLCPAAARYRTTVASFRLSRKIWLQLASGQNVDDLASASSG